MPAGRSSGERSEVALGDARRARVEIDHGAGELRIRSHVVGDNLLEGTFAGGVEVRERLDGDRLVVTLRPPSWLAWPAGRGGRTWSVTLTRDVPLELSLRTGASHAEAELSDLRVETLRIETGAGATSVTIPATGRPQVHVRAGAAEVRLTVPATMAARIETRGALSDVRVDPYRFPRDGEAYRSRDYDEATDRADVVVEAGAAAVVVS
jgi:hypothetical protein